MHVVGRQIAEAHRRDHVPSHLLSARDTRCSDSTPRNMGKRVQIMDMWVWILLHTIYMYIPINNVLPVDTNT
jgi:hypothetical protein